MKTSHLKKSMLIVSIFAGLTGCSKDSGSTEQKEYFTDITYEVTGINVTNADITYGDEKYSDANNPNLLVWLSTSESSALLPKVYASNTCVGHPVKLSAIAAGHSGASLTLRIKDSNKVVAEITYNSNGFLWGGILEYNIPSH
jgi:hypothetical protein